MVWIIVIFIALLFSVITYSQRFTAKKQFKGLLGIQFFYLAIFGPIVAISVINLATEVLNRPTHMILPMPEGFIYSLFVFSIIVAAVGLGIHSTSASITEIFPKGDTTHASHLNKKFHGPLSHYLLYLGCIFGLVFFSLLEVNHPLPGVNDYVSICTILGVGIGIMFALSILWSGYVRINLLFSFFACLCLYLLLSYIHPMQSYPVFTLCISLLTTSTIVLTIGNTAFMRSKKTQKFLVKRVFPHGHPLKETIILNEIEAEVYKIFLSTYKFLEK